jgi:hypothetical protein
MRRLRALRVLPLLVCVLSFGCSISTSSQSVSDSSASSESSSRSSTKLTKTGHYREDIRTYTAAYVRSGGSFDAFEKTVGDLARRHGVTNWEDDAATFAGIGQGLADAGVRDAELETFKATVSRSNTWRSQAIQQGYDTRE